MKNRKEGIVLVYVLFLASMTIVFATILLSNNAYLFNITKYFDLNSKIENNINIDSKIIVDINRSLNLNGTGFIDNISCPDGTSITFSGNLNIDHTGSILVNDGSNIYCLAKHNSNDVYIHFNDDFTDFISASYYNENTVGLTSGSGGVAFTDSDSTTIDFSGHDYMVPDGFDDNYNSDNYSVSSTGVSFSGTYYNDFVEDDDVLGKKTLIGYVSPDSGFKKVFWNTTKTSDFINANINNSDPINIKIGFVTSGILHFDIDKAYEIKLMKFNKSTFNTSSELKRVQTLGSINGSGIGYLQDDMTLSAGTGSAYSFDFANNDYAIFLKSTSIDALLYGIKGEDSSGKGIYIAPIDDSGTGSVLYLGNEILIDDDGTLSHQHIKKIYIK